MVERTTGRVIGKKERSLLSRGADEIDLVRSGLEETMVEAYREIRDIMKRNKKIEDLRTAAFVCAIRKVGSDYINMGIFP
jgi:glutamate dehydrogenase (NAD(P)+)